MSLIWISSIALPPETTGGFSLGLPPSDSQGTAGWWFFASKLWIDFGRVVDIWCGGVVIFIQFCHWNNASDGPIRNTERFEGVVLRVTHVHKNLYFLPRIRLWLGWSRKSSCLSLPIFWYKSLVHYWKSQNDSRVFYLWSFVFAKLLKSYHQVSLVAKIIILRFKFRQWKLHIQLIQTS